jgi:hypothetical protein
VRIRPPRAEDAPAVVALLADDEPGARRETPGDLAPYQAAFTVIDDPNQRLVVAERDGAVVGCGRTPVL